MTAILNGQRRPNLSDQINRLDRILDGLADGLNESVASAVQVAVHAAVKEATETVLRELFTGAAVLPALAAAMAPPQTKLPVHHRIGHGVRWLWRKTVAVVTALPATVRRSVMGFGKSLLRVPNAARRATVRRITRTAATVTGLILVAWRLRRAVPMAITAGLGAAALGYSATPVLAAVLHGVTITAIAMMARLLTPAPLPRFTPKRT